MQTSSRSLPGGRAGFTLPELLIVIVIIGITARLAIPAFTAMMTSGRLSGAASVLQQDLQYARLQAIRRGAPAYFRTSYSTPTTYTITIESGGSVIRTVKTGSLSEFGKNTTVAAPSDVIAFSTRGLLLTPQLGSATAYAKVTITRGTKTDSVLVYQNGRIYHAPSN
ncbi:MAG TPA: GspH/FimT family pseudopilin [Longimicrobiaceae bacterium]|nr:GspH/FimT family pseudopilin [Longimicrobiaceae bacterium]